MSWLFIGIATISSCEIFLRTSIFEKIFEVKITAGKAAHVMRCKSISDNWKEWVLPRYSFRIAKASVLFFAELVLVLLPFFMMGVLANAINVAYFDQITSMTSIAAVSIFAIGYIFIRKKINQKSKYSLASKFLHHLALNSNIRSELYFDIEKLLFSKNIESSTDGNHVFVCGLARSGTTVLMRALHQSEEFSSLTYRDMPFVLAPNMWDRITMQSKRSMEKEIRAHGDGIFVDFDSPEALDEVFWRVFAGKKYIFSHCIKPHETDLTTVSAFREYVALINLKYQKKRYLSKNNNNILRLKGIIEAFPNAKVLIPFREPLQHAYSLLKQHRNFIAQHEEDKFTEKYMSWLVHHEFGPNHRPFDFNSNISHPSCIDNIDYWLYQWVNVYSHLVKELKTSNKGLYFVSYNQICRENSRLWNNLLELLEIVDFYSFDFILSEVRPPTPENEDLKKKAYEVYKELLCHPRSIPSV